MMCREGKDGKEGEGKLEISFPSLFLSFPPPLMSLFSLFLFPAPVPHERRIIVHMSRPLPLSSRHSDDSGGPAIHLFDVDRISPIQSTSRRRRHGRACPRAGRRLSSSVDPFVVH